MKQIKKQYQFICRCLCLWFILLLVLQPSAVTADSVSAEYKLKAALIYKLIRFIEWPEAYSSVVLQNKPAQKHFGLCVLGRDDFGSALDVLNGRKVGTAIISVQRFKQSESISRSCQLVFISDSKPALLKPILFSIRQYPILTIGDSPGFAKKGGMIQLVHGDKHIGFNINLQRAKASGLKISAPLLELSTIVASEPGAWTQ